MPFVAAKCTNCGANLTVDDTKDAAVCEYCNMPFIVEKAITNMNIVVNNNLAVESAIINIQNSSNNPSVNNLLKRAEEFENNGDFVTAIDYYEKVLDLDYSNAIARGAIDRITNTPIVSIPISGGFVKATLTLTRKNLTYQSKRKTEVYPVASILSVNRLVARIMIATSTKQAPLDWAIGSAKNAKLLENAIKDLLAERKTF